MKEESQTGAQQPDRIEPRKLLAMGIVVGVSALALFSALSAGVSDADVGGRDAKSSELSDAAAAATAELTPRTYLFGGNEFLPNPGRRHAAVAPQTAEPSESAETAAAPRDRELAVVVMPGDTLGRILDANDITRQDAQEAIAALKPVFDPRRLVPGQGLKLSVSTADDGNLNLARLVVEPEPGRRSIVTRGENGKFHTSEEHDPISVETSGFKGTIDSSLFAAGERAGVPPAVLQQLIKLFSYDVDFQRDIRKGDSFEVMVDRRLLPDGTSVGEGDIDYASITLSGVTTRLYRYENAAGFVDYYNEKGQSVRKALLRTPVDGAKISSGFGMRNHPVLGFTKMHKGVDFAAPIGTPVYAAGDGVIEKAEPWSSYGNYLRIRHTGTYSTAYGHLSGYAKGIHAGVRVRQGQIVAYSGNTGRTTGPHLHYEVLVSNQQVNPLNIKMPSGIALAGEDLRRFGKLRQNVDHTYSALATNAKVAAAKSSETVR